MKPRAYRTLDGRPVTAVTAAEMREVDQVAVEAIGLSLLMMMEHAGRSLAETVLNQGEEGPVAVLAGGGGNGGGGLCAARHLANHGRDVDVVLDRDPGELAGAPARQYRVLDGTTADRVDDAKTALDEAAVIVDALVGYSLAGPLRNRAAELVELVDDATTATVVALDVPSGVDATTGERPGVAVEPYATVTLALPKTGLASVPTKLWLADLGIPSGVYDRAGLDITSPFDADAWRVRLKPAGNDPVR